MQGGPGEVEMADKRTRRQQKKRERSKKKAAERSARRAARVGGKGAGASPAQAAAWPAGECFAGDNWHEQGARLQVVFTRRRADGRVGAAFCEVDLGERGLVSVEVRTDLEQGTLNYEVSLRAQDRPMVIVEPDLAVKVVLEAAAFGEHRGRDAPAALPRARALFGAIDGSTCRHDILCADGEDAGSGEAEASQGLMSRLTKMLKFGG